MSDERQNPTTASSGHAPGYEAILVSGASCELDAGGHCVTCADEAVSVRVVHVDQDSSIAIVSVEDKTEEVDISLVDHVGPGALLLVHGGVAIANLVSIPDGSEEQANNSQRSPDQPAQSILPEDPEQVK